MLDHIWPSITNLLLVYILQWDRCTHFLATNPVALDHINTDIRRSIPGNLRPLMTNIPASSMYSVRSGTTRGRTISVSDSPLATSSNASSEVSVNNNRLCIEIEDDIGCERGGRSPASMLGR
ncbi:hypothetical protein Dsin_000593 [Dipteronia sinensis]|uniref:Uncharacterized protein n=1 Tax=Dipteronia sinensis TaxID=43782 RepID=A0AAE0EI66_9ROSI|nr:hypothetical protein Dsin_000593 [Dipteronia sinensis]